jgi:hypothetical protein
MGCPSMKIFPEEASYSRFRRLKIVDFPEPFAPTMTTNWPLFMEKETLSRAFRVDSLAGYSNDTSLHIRG